ncbi:MAG: hypothetical protein ACLGPL_11040, partial [Acidobacteriota bacterium]
MLAIVGIVLVTTLRYDLKVVFVGGKACTDGNTIVLPSLPERLGELGLILLRGYSDHEIAHILHTDFDAVRHAFKGLEDGALKAMWNSIEDLRIERRHGADFYGARVNMEALANDVLEEADLSHPLMWLFIEGRRHVCGYDLKGASYDGIVRKIWGDDVYERIAALKDTGEAMALARVMVEAYGKRRDEPFPEPQGEGSQQEGGKAEGGEGGGPSREDSCEETCGMERRSVGLPGIDDAVDPLERVRERLESLHAEAIQRGDYLVYDRSLDSLEPMSEAVETAEYERLKESLGTLNAMGDRVRGLFLARTASRWINGRERGRLDPRALARVETGCRSVFREKTTSRERDTAVSLLIDFSASMGGGHRGLPLEQAMKAAVFLLECLEGSGIAT